MTRDRFIRGTGGSPVSRLWKIWASRPCHGLLVAALLLLLGAGPSTTTSPAPRFTYVDIQLNTHNKPLAAYQFEFTGGAACQIVGIEGSEHPAFAQPPYYDPAAMQGDRVIAAAYSTADQLPAGKTRIARLHLRVTGQPAYQIRLIIAGGVDGKPMPAEISIREGDAK